MQQKRLSERNGKADSGHKSKSLVNNRKDVSSGGKGPAKTPSRINIKSSVGQTNLKDNRENGVNNLKGHTSEVKKPTGNFTFKHMNKTEIPSSPRTVSTGRQKLREEDSLEPSSSSKSSRNDVALADSKISIPKRSWNGKAKNVLRESKENLQSSLDGWFTCATKRRKEEDSPPPSAATALSMDEDIVEIKDPYPSVVEKENRKQESGGFLVDPTPFVIKNTRQKDETLPCVGGTDVSSEQESEDGHRLGSAPRDKFGLRVTSQLSEQHSDNDGALVECPLCSGMLLKLVALSFKL